MFVLKKYVRGLYYSIQLFIEYYGDFRCYRRWNYNNPVVHTQNSLEAKIYRQTHTIEKGMSISKPRVGFGVKKIEELVELLKLYISEGFDLSNSAFINAIGVMYSYMDFQKSKGYENEELYLLIESFHLPHKSDQEYGIKSISKSKLNNNINGTFKQFFCSRHSVRQYEDKAVSIEDIKQAIELAQKAPTACNRQASKVYMNKDCITNVKLGKLIAGNTGFEDDVKNYLVLTVYISSFYDPFERNQLYVEGGIFACALVEALHYYGIASCILQNGERRNMQKQLRKVCSNIPQSEKIIMFIAIGYYKEEITYAVSNRKDVDEVLKIQGDK